MLVQDIIPLITPSVKKVIVDLNQILDLQYCLGLLGEMIWRSIYSILFHFLSPSSSSSISLSSHPISLPTTPPHHPSPSLPLVAAPPPQALSSIPGGTATSEESNLGQ